MTYLTIAAIAVIATIIIVRKVDARVHEQAAENAQLSDRMLIYPPKPLSPENAAVVRSLMDEDCDLWWHLDYARIKEGGTENEEKLDREPYYQKVVEYGRFLHVLDPIDRPALCYGLFDDNNETLFRVWIEYGNRDKTVWVLSGDENHLVVTRFSDFRVYHPGLAHRRFITFL